LAGLSSFGYGQIDTDKTVSRALGTTYYSITGKPFRFCVEMNVASSAYTILTVNGISRFKEYNSAAGSAYKAYETTVFPGQSYSVTSSGSSLIKWTESI
jgi:hypothetical protein